MDIAMSFLRIILKRTWTEAHVYMRRHQGSKVKHFDVFNVIYRKFSHCAVSYTLNGENVNVKRHIRISDNSRVRKNLSSFSHTASLPIRSVGRGERRGAGNVNVRLFWASENGILRTSNLDSARKLHDYDDFININDFCDAKISLNEPPSLLNIWPLLNITML